MERAYRQRVEAMRGGFFGVSAVCLAFSHFTFGPLFPPLIATALICVALAMKGERVLFPLGWSTFDVSKPSPALEEEARALARQMGIRMGGLRASPGHDERIRVRWSGRTALVSALLRDLPAAERRFALARALAFAPNWIGLYGQYGAWPTFYAWYAAWQFGYPSLALPFAALLVLWPILALVRLYRNEQTATDRALAATGDRAGALAYLHRDAALGSRRAARELAALESAPTVSS